MHSVAGPGRVMYGVSPSSLSSTGMRGAPVAALTAASQDLAPVPPEERYAASEYDTFLNQLKFNSKEIINNLTKIAGENVKNVNGIAFVVERRIVNSPPSEKLPYLYLLDSIVKNISGVYVHRFSQNLYNVFRNVFTSSPPATRASLHRLLNTWPPIFGQDLVIALRRAAVECESAAQVATRGPNVENHSGAPRVPLSRPTVAPGRYRIPKISNHPGRSRSIVQVPIPKRQSAVQQPLQGSLGMGVGINNSVSHMPLSSVTGTIGTPMHGMEGIYGIQVSQGMQQMVHSGVHGLPMQSMHGIQGMQNVQQAYAMQQQLAQPQIHAQTSLPGQVQGIHSGVVASSHMTPGANYVGGVSAGVGTAPIMTERQRETQRLMAELTRKSANGIGPTNDEYAGINSFIDVQLRSAPSHSEREHLLALQRQLHAAYSATSVASQRQTGMAHTQPVLQTASAQPQQQLPSYLSSAVPPSQTPVVVPALNANALSNLMRSLPELARSAQAVQQQGHVEQVRAQQRTQVVHHDPRTVHAAQPGAMQIISPAPMPFSAIRTSSHTSFVREIYTDLSHLSPSDRMRFATKEELRAHLDWLFARNRRKRARDQSLTSAGVSRCWFDPVVVFLGEKTASGGPSSAIATSTSGDSSVAGNAASSDPLNACVEARGDNERCPACLEEFVSFWHEEKQAWMLKEALRNKHGKAYHTRCALSIPNIDEHDAHCEVDGTRSVKQESQTEEVKSAGAVSGQDKTMSLVTEHVPIKEEAIREVPAVNQEVKDAIPAVTEADPVKVAGNASAGAPRKRSSVEIESTPVPHSTTADTTDRACKRLKTESIDAASSGGSAVSAALPVSGIAAEPSGSREMQGTTVDTGAESTPLFKSSMQGTEGTKPAEVNVVAKGNGGGPEGV